MLAVTEGRLTERWTLRGSLYIHESGSVNTRTTLDRPWSFIPNVYFKAASFLNSSSSSFLLCKLYAYISPSDPGACFLYNDCPSDEDSDSADPASCPSRPCGEGSSSCVETTAYALRALLAVGDRGKTVCLAQWLVQIKSGSGGFYSSQVSDSKQTFRGHSFCDA